MKSAAPSAVIGSDMWINAHTRYLLISRSPFIVVSDVVEMIAPCVINNINPISKTATG